MDPMEGDRPLRLPVGRAADPAVLDATVRAARTRSDLVAALPEEEETRRHTAALVARLPDPPPAGLTGLHGLAAARDR